MAATNFAAQTANEKMVWSRKTWIAARDLMFITQITGPDANAPVQKITELTPTEKGDKCIFYLVADLVEDGGTGDDEREGNEEEMQSSEQVITIDLLNHGIREKGKMANQRTVLSVRAIARDRLAYWLANRVDQMAILTLSGISYSFNNDGSLRPARSKLKNLAFANDVSAPTLNRSLTWNGTNLLKAGDTGFGTANITSAYIPKYKMIVDGIAYARTHRVKPLLNGGKKYYMFIMHPMSYAMIKMDDNWQRAVTLTGGSQGTDNPWFTGADVKIDGAVVIQHELVYSTLGAASGSKWGAGGAVNGSRTLLLGAQALAMADLNISDWVEKLFQYDSFWGINVDKMFGLLKPKFYSTFDNNVEDFGVIAIDHFLG